MKFSSAQSAQLRLPRVLLANNFQIKTQPPTEVSHARLEIDVWFASEPDSTTILFWSPHKEEVPAHPDTPKL
jgi:hypothetical protein